MGHRERKQQSQRREIIANTVALLREQPAEAIRVRDIGVRSAISDATFFNYFPSKDAVVREWVDDLVDAAFEQAARDYEAGMPLRRAVRGVAESLAARAGEEGAPFARGLTLLGVLPVAASRPPPRGRVVRPGGATQLLDTARERGEVRGDVSADQLGETLRAAMVSALAHAATLEPVESTPRLAARVRQAADVVLDGMRKRNERVQVQAPTVHASGARVPRRPGATPPGRPRA